MTFAFLDEAEDAQRRLRTFLSTASGSATG